MADRSCGDKRDNLKDRRPDCHLGKVQRDVDVVRRILCRPMTFPFPRRPRLVHVDDLEIGNRLLPAKDPVKQRLRML